MRQRDGHVDDALGEEVHAQDGVVLHAHQRDAVDGVDVEAAQADLVQVGHEPELHAVAPTVVDDAHDRFVRRAGQGDDHLRDALLVDDALELVRACPGGGSGRSRASPSVARKPATCVAEMRPPGERLHDHAPDRVVADDQGALHADAALVQHAQHPQADGAAEDHQHGHQHPGEDQRQARFGRVAHERRAGEQQHDRQPSRGEDRRQVVQRAGGARQAVQPAQGEDERERRATARSAAADTRRARRSCRDRASRTRPRR